MISKRLLDIVIVVTVYAIKQTIDLFIIVFVVVENETIVGHNNLKARISVKHIIMITTISTNVLKKLNQLNNFLRGSEVIFSITAIADY